MESLNLGPQPKAAAVASFTLSQAPSSSTSSCTTTSNTNLDFPTVNLSDLHEFFPNISSAMAQEPIPSQANTASSQASSSFNHQGPQFRVDDDDIPEFPSFPEAQAQGNLYSLNMDDFEDLLNPANESGNGSSLLAQASCQQAAPSSSTTVPNNTASQNTSDPASNPGSTWMNYPNSIVSLLQNEGMINTAANNNHQQGPMLDEFDELMSADEDRLISIFNSENQAGFVSGHQT